MARRKKQSEAPADEGAALVDTFISPERKNDPSLYSEIALEIDNKWLSGKMNTLEHNRVMDGLAQASKRYTGLTLEEISQASADPFLRFKGLVDSSTPDLLAIREGLAKVDSLRLSDSEKKRYTELIDLALTLQAQGRADAAKFAVYVGRDQTTNKMLKMGRPHVGYFDIWNNPEIPHSLIEAPFEHGKSSCLLLQVAYDLGTDSTLRYLVLCDTDDKARKQLQTIKRIMKSGPFRALFPDVRVLERRDDDTAQNSSKRFTVTRVNTMSREPSVEAAAICSNINGNGYDRIAGDDFCPPIVRYQPSVRRDCNQRWDSVITQRLRVSEKRLPRIRIICNPWHEDDVAGRICRDAADGLRPDWIVGLFPILDGPDGKAIPIWPEQIGQDYLEAKKRTCATYGLSYRLISKENHQNAINRVFFYPKDPSDSTLKETLAQSERWLSLDPSGSGGRQSSDQGMMEIVITPRGYVFVPECWYLRLNVPGLLDWLVQRIISQPAPGYFGLLIEAQGGIKAGVDTWRDYIPKLLAEKGYTRRLEIVDTRTGFGSTNSGGAGRNISKYQRLIMASPYIENGLVRFGGVTRKTAMPNNETKTEYVAPIGSAMERFTASLKTYDGTQPADCIDALTQWILTYKARIRDRVEDVIVARKAAVQMQDPLERLMARQMEEDRRRATPEKDAYEQEGRFYEALERCCA